MQTEDLVTWCVKNNKQAILDEWDYSANSDIKPEQLAKGSGKKVWWKCRFGHKWKTTVKNRTLVNSGCPVCGGKTILPGFNDFATWCERNSKKYLLDEWDYEKNKDVTPQNVAPKTAKKVWWICKNGHNWQASMLSRASGRGCPVCLNRVIHTGTNDLASWCKENDRQDLLNEWDYDKNGKVSPNIIAPKTSIKVWWRCDKGHDYIASVAHRVNDKSGCPICAGLAVKKGFNDLASWCRDNNRADILNEWNYGKNGELSPQTVTPKTNKKVWWKCDKGHEYLTAIAQRTDRGTSCPICAGLVVEKGVNDLATWCRQNNKLKLLDEWDQEKNGTLSPEMVTKSANKRIWWRCGKGHSWFAALSSRTYQDTGCPYCGNKKVLAGYNDLRTWCEQNNRNILLREWDYNKNDNLTPEMVTRASNKRVWWKCDKGHSWAVQICSRTSDYTGCPFCASSGTSFPEQAVAYYLSKSFSIKQRHRIDGFEFDIFLDKYDVGIEYDGVFFHSKERVIRREKLKDTFSENHGIRLIRIRESKQKDTSIEDNTLFYSVSKSRNNVYLDDEFNKVLEMLMLYLEKITGIKAYKDIDVARDEILIRERYLHIKKQESLSALRPDLIKEWNARRNGSLSPDSFSRGSNIRVWWMCEKGHEWEASVRSRAIKNTGCPVCDGKIILQGFNDLETWCVENNQKTILYEWDYEKNVNISPHMVAPKTRKKVWWKCNNGHSWQAQICNRVAGNRCPLCMNRNIKAGFNDFATWCKENDRQNLLSEWDYENNGETTPYTISPSSSKKVWWHCSNNHKWQATVCNRKKGQGCPICTNHKIQSGYNDLATWCKENGKQYLLDEWDYVKNNNITPEMIAKASQKKIWWKCKKGHSWQARVQSRTKLEAGCPVCSGRIKQIEFIE